MEGWATHRVTQTGKATSAGRCPSPRSGHWVLSPAEGAVLLKEQGLARPLEGDVGVTEVWLLADQKQRWGVQAWELGQALNPSVHTLGTGGRHLFSCVGLSSASGKDVREFCLSDCPQVSSSMHGSGRPQ